VRAGGAAPFDIEDVIEVPPVGRPGERVGGGDLVECLDGAGEMLVGMFEIALRRRQVDRCVT
jgi:hypothetical protein